MLSLASTVRRFAGKVLPASVVKQLSDLEQRLPIKLTQAAPVVQMYIDDAHTRSYVGVNNFYSCLLPHIETAADVELRFYSAEGRLLAKSRHELPHFAARAVDVRDVLRGKSSTHGVVTAQITPRAPRRRIYRELGQVAAQFYVFFRDRETGSVEQTHPLSTTDVANRPSPPFTSSQIISTAKLRQLMVFQYNPGPSSHALEHSLVDLATGKPFASQRHSIPALGSVRSMFAFDGSAPPHLSFCVDALPAANAKPMLRRVFDGGRHSMSHA